jgi:hypothetical protein
LIRGGGEEDFHFEMRDARYGIWDTRYGIRDMGYGIWDTRCGIWNPGYEIRDMGWNRVGAKPFTRWDDGLL